MKRLLTICAVAALMLAVTGMTQAVDRVVPGTYATIQLAIDAANPGDTIIVAAGTYAEYLHITTDDLTVQGAGIDQSIIDLDGLTPYWHYQGCSSSYASRAGVLISGYGSPGTPAEVVENVIFKGFTVKNAGLNPPIPYPEFYDNNGDGWDDMRGISIANGKNVTIEDCKVTDCGYGGINTGYARCVSTHKYSEGITVNNCIVRNHPWSGINIGNNVGSFTVTNNVCENIGQPHYSDPTREYMGYGIQVSGTKNYGTASGLISGNTCSNNGFEGIIVQKYTDGVTVENNIVTGHNSDQDGAGIFMYHWGSPQYCKNHIVRNNTVTGNIRGIVAYYASYCTIQGNTITTDSGSFPAGQGAIKLDNANNITVRDNTISCDGTGITVQSYDSAHNSSANTFTGNTINGAKFAGVLIYGPYARDNTFTGNTITGTTSLTLWAGSAWEETQADGVFIDDDAGTGNVFHKNNILGNDDDGMENQTITPVDATDNWWGDVSGPYHPTIWSLGLVEITNPDGMGDAVSDYVLYMPWLGMGGFVTGGGTIWSEAGNYRWDVEAAGEANFGFVSKYKKGRNVPDGSTNFVFQAGDLHFHSSSYDWLVVTGSNYAMFKGSGTINGSGEYKFMLWAGDGGKGDDDTFRIKIWEEDEFGLEDVVYDNGMDQVIDSGSIIIHTK